MVRYTSQLTGLIGLLSATVGLAAPAPGVQISAEVDLGAAPQSPALYFLQNDPKGTSIVALSLCDSPQAPAVIPLGGKGALVFNLTSGTSVPIDTLNSQGAVAVDRNLLFAVNPGSNAVSVLKINPADPTHPKLVGKPVDSMGDFPMSVAYSATRKLACVLNGGVHNSLACFKVDPSGALTPDGPARPLNLNLTTPPKFQSGTTSEVHFSPDLNFLVTTNKGSTAEPGSIIVWPIEKNGSVSQTGIKSTIPDIEAPFGFAFAGNSEKLLVTDASYGGSVVDISPGSFKASELVHNNETGKLKVSCWAIYSPLLNKLYAVDAGATNFGVYDPASGKFQGLISYDSSFLGGFDSVVDYRDGKIAYFLTGTDIVAGINLKTGSTVRSWKLGQTSVGPRQYWTGMAMWMPGQGW